MSFSPWMLAIILLAVLVFYHQHLCFAGENEWTSIGPEGKEIIALAIDPVTPSTIYAGTWGSGVYKTTDGGSNWFAVNSGLSGLTTTVFSLAIDPVTPTIVYAAAGAGVFKTTDGGGNWVAVNSGLLNTTYGMAIPTLAIDPVTPTTLYVAVGGKVGGNFISRVFKTINGGVKWTEVNTGLPLVYDDQFVRALVVDPVSPTRVYAGTRGYGVFSIDFVESEPPDNGGGGGSSSSGGGGGGCSIASDVSPSHLVYFLIPLLLLLGRKARRKLMLF